MVGTASASLEEYGALPVEGAVVAFDAGWQHVKRHLLERALERVGAGADGKSRRVLEAHEVGALYSLVYQMCTQPTPHNWSGKLYYAFLDELVDMCQAPQTRVRQAGGGKVLETLIGEWDKHRLVLKAARGVLAYLDRFYVQRLALLPLEGVGVRAFREHVFEPNRELVRDAFLRLVERDRAGGLSASAQSALSDTLRRVTAICVAVGDAGSPLEVYERELQAPLLEHTLREMSKLANRWLEELPCERYLARVRAQLQHENERVDRYLHEESREQLVRACERQLIGAHIERIVEMPGSGARALLRQDKAEALQLMFALLKRVPNGLAPMAAAFRQHLQEVGAELLARPQYANQRAGRLDDTLVQRLVELHQKYRQLIKGAWAEHNTFHRALKDAFEQFINLPLPPDESAPGRLEVSISELLSDFIDRRLRKPPQDMIPPSPPQAPSAGGAAGGAGAAAAAAHLTSYLTPRSETQLERHLAQTVELIAFVQDKDVFAHFYRKHLAKRLVLGRSSSLDAEQVVVGKLQLVGGSPFVSKLTGMLKDLLMARDVQAGFSASCGAQLPCDARVQVLTSGFWPAYKEEPLAVLPAELARVVELFRTYYASRTAHRQLQWVHSLGSLELRCRFASQQRMDVTLTTHQGAALLLFNQPLAAALSEPPEWLPSYAEVAQRLGVGEATARKHLRPLVQGKYRLLLEDAQGRLRVNWAFTCDARQRKIRVPMMREERESEAQEERETSLIKISEERRYAVEASVCKIMKQTKVLAYAELCAKVVEDLRRVFWPQAQTIRKRVDDLVQRDYLVVDADDKLRYVA